LYPSKLILPFNLCYIFYHNITKNDVTGSGRVSREYQINKLSNVRNEILYLSTDIIPPKIWLQSYFEVEQTCRQKIASLLVQCKDHNKCKREYTSYIVSV